MRKLQGFKKQFKEMLMDERGITVSSESLILIVGTSIVASIVVASVTKMLIGDSRDGKGGITKNVVDNVDKIMENISPVKP